MRPPDKNGPPEWQSAILFAHIKIGDSDLMASDVPPDRHKPVRSAYLFLSVAGAAEAELVFSALSQGGETIMPLQETFWALRFAMVRDQFGVLWMVSAGRPQG